MSPSKKKVTLCIKTEKCDSEDTDDEKIVYAETPELEKN